MQSFGPGIVPQEMFFFTVRAAPRVEDIFVREIAHLRRITRVARIRYAFDIDAIVVLPGVIHTIWALPSGDPDFRRPWRLIRTLFTRSVTGADPCGDQHLALRGGLWQRNYRVHRIRDTDDLAAYRRLIHDAPVQAGLVERPEAWIHSSIHRAKREAGQGAGPVLLAQTTQGLRIA